MRQDKIIKDAVHGYISLDEPFLKIVDMPEFQRLRWIEQTSYRVLYPAARHDRFIHSLGVFHLGRQALAGLKDNTSGKTESAAIDKMGDSFLLACLLHDFGHAPFSHTTEDFFPFKQAGQELSGYVNKSGFTKDFQEIGKDPAPHEVISAILICKHWEAIKKKFSPKRQKTLSLELVVRCVIGCTYEPDRSPETGIKDCLIRLLNSQTVDVDKLDYIARDANMSGYDNVHIDTDRLIRSVCHIIDPEGVYHPAFLKTALSVVENVISAKNAVAKWIISHQSVIYERFLIRDCIGEMVRKLTPVKSRKTKDEKKLAEKIFSIDALGIAGVKIEHPKGNTFSLRLLADPDVIHILKQEIRSPAIHELFDRSSRRRPIWKSREEFVHLCGGFDAANDVLKLLAPLNTLCETKMDEYSGALVLTHSEIKKTFRQTPEIVEAFNPSTKDTHTKIDFVLLPDKNTFNTRIDPWNTFIRFSVKPTDFSSYGNIIKPEPEEKEVVADNISKSEKKKVPACLDGFFYLYTHAKIPARGFLKKMTGIKSPSIEKKVRRN